MKFNNESDARSYNLGCPAFSEWLSFNTINEFGIVTLLSLLNLLSKINLGYDHIDVLQQHRVELANLEVAMERKNLSIDHLRGEYRRLRQLVLLMVSGILTKLSGGINEIS